MQSLLASSLSLILERALQADANEEFQIMRQACDKRQ